MIGAPTKNARPAGYRDVGGRVWPTAKLDALLARPEVAETVRRGIASSLGPSGRLLPGTAYAWAHEQYRRTECGDLLLLLMVRQQDREVRDAA